MHEFGKRLSALLLVMGIAILSIAMLPVMNVDAHSDEHQKLFSSERGNIDWESIWENRHDGRENRSGSESRHGIPDPSIPSVPSADGAGDPGDTTTPDQGQGQEDPETTQPTTPAQQTPSDGNSTTPSTGAASLDAIESEVLNLINAHRQENGLAPLSSNSALNASSNNHSQDMAENGYFSHTSLDGSSPFDRMRAAGYSCGTMGENIAAGQSSAQQVFEGWVNSPGHNANMLNPNFVSVGIGLVQAPDSPYGYYWTTNFGGC